MKKISFIFLSVAATLLARAGHAFACAVCLGGGDGVSDGYNASVLFLMSTPYLVVGAIIGGLVLTYRRAQKQPKQDGETMTVAWKQEESGR
jgi:hypothetical protein